CTNPPHPANPQVTAPVSSSEAVRAGRYALLAAVLPTLILRPDSLLGDDIKVRTALLLAACGWRANLASAVIARSVGLADNYAWTTLAEARRYVLVARDL